MRNRLTSLVIFDLNIIGFSVGASDSEKIHQPVLEDGKTCKPEKEDIPHANKGGALNNLGATKENVVIIVVIHDHDHVSNHAQGLQDIENKAKHANVVTLVSLNDHTIIMLTDCIRSSIFVLKTLV